jgi:cell division transport system permease protein
LDDDATVEVRKAVEQLLSSGAVVEDFQFISKADALKRFKETFTDLANAADTLGGNPMPASYEVRLRTSEGAPQAVDDLARQLRETPGVIDVRYDRLWLDRLQSAVSVVQGIGFGFGGFLTLAAALTVANVVRLALYARRDEIEIMQLVGAPTAYIRGPFIMEGILQGGIGAAVALAVLAAAFLLVRGTYLTPLATALSLTSVRFLSLESCLFLLVGGMLVGCFGGYVASGSRA